SPLAIPGAILAQAGGAGQPAERHAQVSHTDGQYAFLAAAGIARLTPAKAEAEGARRGVAGYPVPRGSRPITSGGYASALASELSVPVADWASVFDLRTVEDADDAANLGLPARIGDAAYWVLCAEDGNPETVRQRVRTLHARGLPVALASRRRINA